MTNKQYEFDYNEWKARLEKKFPISVWVSFLVLFILVVLGLICYTNFTLVLIIIVAFTLSAIRLIAYAIEKLFEYIE